MAKTLGETTDVELKALAYDFRKSIDMLQTRIGMIDAELERRKNKDATKENGNGDNKIG